MGIRKYQEVGLKPEAQEWLENNVRKIAGSSCPHCGGILSLTKEVIRFDQHDSFYGDGPTLHTYKTINGGTAREVLQAEPWSSGPVAFFCLEIDGQKMFKWTDKEIEDCL